MLRKIFNFIFSFTIAGICTIILGHIVCPVATAMRGYYAIGGEHLLLLLFFTLVFYLCSTTK